MNECSTCRFFAPHPQGDNHEVTGDCRRNPPTILPFNWKDHMNVEAPDLTLMHTVWPAVYDDTWCGEWLGKPEQANSSTS